MLPPGLADLPGLPKDAAALQAMLAQVQQMFAGGGDGPVNWEPRTTWREPSPRRAADPDRR